VVQCVAVVCLSVLQQCVVLCFSVLPWASHKVDTVAGFGSVLRSVLQCVAVLQCSAVFGSSLLQCAAGGVRTVLQCATVDITQGDMLQCGAQCFAAVCCSVLQCTAVCCFALGH